MFAHGRLKLQTRDQLQNLTENTAYSVHGGISVRWYWFSTINPTYRRFHLAALAAQSLTLGGSHLIWTRVVTDPYLTGIPSISKTQISLHAKDDTPEVRYLFYKEIKSMPFKAQFVVARKIERI